MQKSNPKLLRSILRGAYKKYISSMLDYNAKDCHSNSLWLISMRITDRCNHRCAICGQFGSKGYNVEGTNKVLGEVPVETYMKMVDEVCHLKPHIYITGGEPFLYKDLIPLVRYMKSKGLTVQIVTNGSLLEFFAEDVVKDEWDWVCYSMDGTADIHNKCRGVPWAHERLVRGINKIHELKAKYKKKKPYLSSLTTLSPVNCNVLLETIEEAEKLNPDNIAIYYSWFTSTKIGQIHSKIMQKELGCTPFAWKSYVRDTSTMNIPKIVELVKEIKSRKNKHPILFIPDIKLSDIPAYYKEPGNFLGFKRCLAPWFQVDIMPNGNIVNCRDFPDLVMGNIKENGILEIYNNEKFRAFRRTLKKAKNGVLPLCSRCCGLMGY
jgi:radical SAM protein with 4Fe4S-binding SPASM domain